MSTNLVQSKYSEHFDMKSIVNSLVQICVLYRLQKEQEKNFARIVIEWMIEMNYDKWQSTVFKPPQTVLYWLIIAWIDLLKWICGYAATHKKLISVTWALCIAHLDNANHEHTHTHTERDRKIAVENSWNNIRFNRTITVNIKHRSNWSVKPIKKCVQTHAVFDTYDCARFTQFTCTTFYHAQFVQYKNTRLRDQLL